MRTAVGVALVTVCLGLAGCSLFGKKQAAQTNNRKPFLGAPEAADKAETAAMPRNSGGPLPNANGVLAGQVLSESTGRPALAYILVKDPDSDDAKAELDVQTDSRGYFTIPGLKVGQQYVLIARAEEDGQLISGKCYAKPPQPTLLIPLDKRFTNNKTPPLPGAPKMPGKKNAADPENKQENKSSVSIGPPIKLPDSEPPTRGGIAGPPAGADSGASSPNPANIADGGFRRIPQPSQPTETINIPPPPPPPPSQPTWESVPGQGQSVRPMSGPSGSVRMPNIPTHVPSCGLYGNRLDNFALHDLEGNVWEYKRDRRERLTLLDFWYHNCGACLSEIPRLVELQRNYGKYGLEVIGIACEKGTLEEQRRNVRAVRGRYSINYTTLLSGGGSEHCPVMDQFQVEYFPLLVLIDADGTILWRSTRDGMDEYKNNVLEKMISGRLVSRQPPP